MEFTCLLKLLYYQFEEIHVQIINDRLLSSHPLHIDVSHTVVATVVNDGWLLFWPAPGAIRDTGGL